MKNFVQEGDRITFAASALTGPNSPIKSGDPVLTTGGRICGVANADAAPTTPILNDGNVVVSLKGVYTLSVVSTHHALVAGATVYIDASTGVLSDDYTDVPFGVAVDPVAQYATTAVRVRLFGATPGAAGADS
jgi:predicted RecA/RadA family phage recombinase